MTPFLIALVMILASQQYSPGITFTTADLDSQSGSVSSFHLYGLPFPVVPVDTVKAGQVYITNLPDSLSGTRVDRYQGIELPAFSWLLDRSFFWRTSIQDKGNHELWFRAFLSDESVDSVAVNVVID